MAVETSLRTLDSFLVRHQVPEGLNSVFDFLPCAIIATTPEGQVLYNNDEALRVLKVPTLRHVALRDWVDEYGGYDDEDFARQLSFEELPIGQALLSKQDSSRSLVLRTRDMPRRTGVLVHYTCHPILQQSGEVVVLLSTFWERSSVFFPTVRPTASVIESLGAQLDEIRKRRFAGSR